MDVQATNASIAIELKSPDSIARKNYYTQLQQIKNILQEITAEEWDWKPEQQDEDGRMISRISKTLPGVNIFNEADWPSIISFLKLRIIALDKFWEMVKDGLE